MIRYFLSNIGKHPVSCFRIDDEIELRLLPKRGCCVQDIKWHGVSVLDGYQTEQEIDEQYINKNEFLFPFGGRLANGKYLWEGKEYQFPLNHQNTHAIHGFLEQISFCLDSIDYSEDQGALITYEGKIEPREYYPFRANVRISFSIKGECITFSISVQNLSNQEMPYSVGWHPYFRIRHLSEVKVFLPPSKQLEMSPDLIPSGLMAAAPSVLEENHLHEIDAVFKYDGRDDSYDIQLNTSTYKMTVSHENSSVLPFYVLYCPPEKNSIAIEPMTGAPDVLNNHMGLKSLAQGEQTNIIFNIRFQEIK